MRYKFLDIDGIQKNACLTFWHKNNVFYFKNFYTISKSLTIIKQLAMDRGNSRDNESIQRMIISKLNMFWGLYILLINIL